MSRRLIVALAIILASATAGAAEPVAGLTALHCAHAFDANSGRMLGATTIIIEGQRIRSVQTGHVATTDMTVIDPPGMTCLPGLIDSHAHLTMQFSKSTYSDKFRLNPTDEAIRSTVYARRTLDAGFTTVRNLGDDGNASIALRNAINQGIVPGPRIFSAGGPIGTTGGHADPTNGFRADLEGDPSPKDGIINSPEDAWKAVRQHYKDGADVIKIMPSGGVDSIEHGTYMDDADMKLMKEHGTWFVPTIIAGKYVQEKAKEGWFPPQVARKAEEVGPVIQATAGKAYKAGVKIAFGTDAGVYPHGQNAKELEYMVEAGMPNAFVLQTATTHAAELLKQSKDLGSLEAGKFADIIGVEGDPLADIKVMQQVDFVMKGGVTYKQGGKAIAD